MTESSAQAAPDAGQSPRLVLASHNAHKLGELRAILVPVDGSGIGDLSPAAVVSATEFGAPEPVEDGLTFAENALIKARALCAATGLPSVADDSGLAVDVLGGAPGIFSARWAGAHGDDDANLDLLLAQLGDIAPEHRLAQFVCAAALVTPTGMEHVELGYLRGSLLTERRGTGGFGYDPILVPEGESRTTAELSAEEKNEISHRGQAFRALAPHIAWALAVN